MNIFVKPEILNKASTPYCLTRIKRSDKDNHRLPELIVLPAAAKALLRKASLSQKVIIVFKKDCMKVLTHVVEKIKK